MSVMIIDEIPTLTDPVLIVAFAGWNDAGGCGHRRRAVSRSTITCSPLCQHRSRRVLRFSEPARTFAYAMGCIAKSPGQPTISFASTATILPQSLVIGIGIEPQLKWETYSAAILDLAKQCGVKLVLTLGALLADVAYSVPFALRGLPATPLWLPGYN